jgi:hypothetical protein
MLLKPVMMEPGPENTVPPAVIPAQMTFIFAWIRGLGWLTSMMEARVGV